MSAPAPAAAEISRGALIRWSVWFGLANAVLFALVGLRYLFVYGTPATPLATLYVALAYVAQFALLGFLPMTLLGCLLALLWPRKGLLLTAGALWGALGLSLMVLDTNVFVQYRFHLSALTVALFDTSTWMLTGIVFVALLGFQAMLAGSVWNIVSRRKSLHGGWLALTLTVVWCGGQGIHIWADATAYAPVTGFTRFMPLYFPMKSKRRLAKLGWVDPAEVEQQRLLRGANAPGGGQLDYPRQPLQCAAPDANAKDPNIVIVFIDALRPDRISPDTMPATAAFATEAIQFSDHYSGGNSSRMGFFSFFYGLPSTYWQTFYDLQREPVLLDELRRHGYTMQAFSAVGFGSPSQIDRTVFAGFSPAAMWSADKDGMIDPNTAATLEWQRWMSSLPGTADPYFGFIYFDPGSFAARAEAALDDNLDEVGRREAGYMAGLAAIDEELAVVIQSVDATANGRDTLVIVASDHGYEFDELGLGYIGHASNYGEWQLRSTLLMRWPGRAPRTYMHRSAHQDVPATLLQELFACENPAADYASGGNLFAGQSWPWIMAGSYTSHAIIQPEQLVVTYPGGLIELLGKDYRPDNSLELDPALMEDAMQEMRRFYR